VKCELFSKHYQVILCELPDLDLELCILHQILFVKVWGTRDFQLNGRKNSHIRFIVQCPQQNSLTNETTIFCYWLVSSNYCKCSKHVATISPHSLCNTRIDDSGYSQLAPLCLLSGTRPSIGLCIIAVVIMTPVLVVVVCDSVSCCSGRVSWVDRMLCLCCSCNDTLTVCYYLYWRQGRSSVSATN
jgi:hypothetical protein